MLDELLKNLKILVDLKIQTNNGKVISTSLLKQINKVWFIESILQDLFYKSYFYICILSQLVEEFLLKIMKWYLSMTIENVSKCSVHNLQ